MIDAPAMDCFRRLSEAFGPSGFEREATRILKDYIAPHADRLSSDKLGSLLFEKRGACDAPKVLLPGHIDEVGFIISGINKQGFLSFNPVGGWFDQVLLAQRVRIRTKDSELKGVIAAKPPHVLSPEERKRVVQQDKMFIDVGACCREEAEAMGIRIGDPVVPDSPFTSFLKPVFENKNRIGDATICLGKAFDNRVGVFMAAEVVRRLRTEQIDHPNTVVGAGTVMEEVGARGARTTAWLAAPDVCLTLEVDVAKDIAGMEQESAPIRMGKGPSIVTFDASMLPNQGLKELVISIAEEQGIPYQLSQMRRGGTDAGAVHVTHAGCPSLVISVPTRHIHSHVAMLCLEDVEHCINLVLQTVTRLDAATVAGLTAI